MDTRTPPASLNVNTDPDRLEQHRNDDGGTVQQLFGLNPSFFKSAIEGLPKFLYAVVNDDEETVKQLLSLNPSLLIMTPADDMIIENKKTWQKFYAEKDALTMAVKLKQIKMIAILLPFYDNLEQTARVIRAKAEAIAAWKDYEVVNINGKVEIVLPQFYIDYVKTLVDVFAEETFPNGVPGENNVPYNVMLSDQTESALSALLNLVVPKNAVKLDEHIDATLLLLTAYDYVEDMAFDENWSQQDAFSRRVIGLIQAALIPEIGKIYRDARLSRVGAGYDFFYDIITEEVNTSCGLEEVLGTASDIFETDCLEKDKQFHALTQQQHPVNVNTLRISRSNY